VARGLEVSNAAELAQGAATDVILCVCVYACCFAGHMHY
jgi:hypothetical protein